MVHPCFESKSALYRNESNYSRTTCRGPVSHHTSDVRLYLSSSRQGWLHPPVGRGPSWDARAPGVDPAGVPGGFPTARCAWRGHKTRAAPREPIAFIIRSAPHADARGTARVGARRVRWGFSHEEVTCSLACARPPLAHPPPDRGRTWRGSRCYADRDVALLRRGDTRAVGGQAR